jgi:WD40 repeat protein
MLYAVRSLLLWGHASMRQPWLIWSFLLGWAICQRAAGDEIKERTSLRGHSGQINSIGFSTNGRTLASGSSDGTVKLWDVATGKELRTVRRQVFGLRNIALIRQSPEAVNSIALASNGKTLAFGDGYGTVSIWSASNGLHQATFLCGSDEVSSLLCEAKAVVVSADDRTLLAGTSDGKIRIWDVVAGKEKYVLGASDLAVNCLALSSDGKMMASGDEEGRVALWEMATGKRRADLGRRLGAVYGVAFNPNGRTLASCGRDETVRVWDLVERVARANLKGHLFPVSSVAFRPDGLLLASGSLDGTVRLWEVDSAKPRMVIENRGHDVECIAWSADGRLLAAGGDDKVVRLWDVASLLPK